MYSFIQFITTPTVDTPGTALYLHFDNKRYIIGNLHEGLQRAALQTGTKIFKARDFFLTGKTEWRSNGGLLGVILTLADSANTAAASKEENERQKLECRRAREEEQAQGSPRKRGKNARERSIAHTPKAPIAVEDPTVTLHGGPNLTHTVATARSFVFRQGIPIKVNEFDGERETSGKAQDWEPSWEDERIQVWKMPILPAKPDDSFQQTSPKKRSLGEYMDGEDSKLIIDDHQRSAKSTASNDSEEHDQQTRKFVVSEMFSSSWRYDKLVPTPLYEVLKPGNLFIRDPATKKIVKYKGPMPDGTTPVPNVEVLVREPWPGATIDRLPPTKPSLLSMSYIIKIHKQRGKFKPEVAKALKVPPGPLWSALASGSEVQSSDDKTITPDMVLEPPKGGAGIAVIELPSTDYVRDLIDRPEWDVQKIMSGVSGIIWILGAGVSNDITLRDFIQKKSALEHIISSPDHCPNYLVHTSAAAAAVRHNCIDPSRFPIPVHSNAVSSPSDVQVHSAVKILSAQRGLKIDLHPSFGISSKDVVPKFDSTAVVQEIPESVVKLAQSARLAIEDSSLHPEVADQRLPSSDAEIICLGTGSAVPSPYRNVSGTLLRVPGHGSYLLDCGENTLGQMRRIFTEAELKEVLRSLKLIWISHLHADHHLGTAAVIKAWYEEVHGKDPGTRPKATLGEYASDPARFIEEGRRLFVVAHHKMMRWLAEYSTVEDFGYDQLVTATSSPNAGRSNINQTILDWNGLNVGFASCQDPKIKNAIRRATSLSNLVAVSVNHCYGAQAVCLTFPNRFKVSYSGDCRPSDQFARAGQGSTVLLHEATFEDELIGDAKAKKHSTTSEAIAVGAAMGAKRVLLTHFSQRYQKVPSVASLQSLNVQLEDPDETENSLMDTEPPDNIENQALTADQTPFPEPSETLPPSQAPVENSDSNPPIRRVHSNIRNPSNPSNTENPATTASQTSFPEPSEISQPSEVPAKNGDSNPLKRRMHSSPKNPSNGMKVGVAFDYMRVKVEDIIHLEKLTPAMRELYKEEEEEEEDKRLKNNAKRLAEGNR